MAKNTLADLNNHLFAQLERLGEEDLKPEELQRELDRSKAINDVAKNIIDNAKVALDGAKFTYNNLPGGHLPPEQFRLKD